MDLPEQLLNHLEGAALRSIRRQNTLAIATSGGLDSSILAALIASHVDIPVHLITASAPGMVDAQRARLLARHLELPLVEIVLTRSTTKRLLSSLAPALEAETIDPARAAEWGLPIDTKRVSPIHAAVGIVLLACAEETARFAKRLVVGQGADEFFGGYAKYQDASAEDGDAMMARDRGSVVAEGVPRERKIAQLAGIQFHYPYLDPGLVAFAKTIPSTELFSATERKPLLREVARRLNLPQEIVEAPKTAAQYGSGAGALLAELAASAGLPQNDFLTDLAQDGQPG